MLQGKKILLGICGSIAAYKSILLLRLLVKQGAEVKVVMTPAAREFVSPLVLSTLSRNSVVSDLSDGSDWANHVMLGRWADLMVVAPLSCNTLSSMATGRCDNLLMAVYLSATCPVMSCPAMDEDMWLHATTKRNIAAVQADGVQVLDVGVGELGSGLVGAGRMMEPEDILAAIQSKLGSNADGLPLKGRSAVVTAGPTYEPIDPVRFIGNHSTGKMGVAVAQALLQAGASVTLVAGPGVSGFPAGADVVQVMTAREMFEAATTRFDSCDIAVMAAAVADFRPASAYESKWKKQSDNDTPPPIELVQNPDILKHCGSHKRPGQIVVGFALETDNEEENARRKLASKNADIIVLNSLRDEGAGFGTSTNKISIFEANGEVTRLPLQSKTDAALAIVERIIARIS